MKNKKNIIKGWLISLLVLLVLFNNISAVKAIDSSIIEETNLTEIDEAITNEDITQEEVLEEDVIEEQTKEEIFTTYSKNLEFKSDEVIVKGNINELITVGELLDNINISELEINYSIEKITVTNEEDNLLASDEYINNKCHLIIISNEYIVNYKISFLGDLNQDNLVNEEDIETGIEDFFKEEPKVEVEENIIEESLKEVDTEEVFSESTKEEIIIEEDKTITEEVSYVDAIIKNNSYEVETPIQEEEINVNLENTSKEEIYVNSNITVELSLEGLINNYTNTISGNIEYNNEILELENIYVTVDNKIIGKYMNNKFIYVLDNYHETTPLLLIIFKSIKDGNTSISITDLKVAMNGTLLNINNNTNLNITILEPGKGGDTEIVIPPTIIIPNPTLSKPQSIPSTNKPITNTTINKVYPTNNNEFISQLSEDNYIKNLEISNHEILFNKDINNYSIEVDHNTNYLDLNVTLNNENSTFTVIGNENFIPGKNEIIITVKSQKGETRDYIIEVNKEEQIISETEKDTITKEESKKEKISKSKTNYKQSIHIFILLILIITIVVFIYKLLKKED